MHLKQYLKGNCSFGEEIQSQNLIIYNNNEAITQTKNMYLFHDWINKMIFEENKVPVTVFEARKAAGSAEYNTIII